MVIKKGTHAPFSFPKLLKGNSILTYRVTFTELCRYDIGPEDQGDINKLFGIGYFTLRKLTMHHYNSVRFGWNYDLENKNMRIFAYWYEKGKRMSKYIKSVEIGEPNDFSIVMSEQNHVLIASKALYFVDVPSKPLGYLLHPYFGGNQTAPHDMEIIIRQL
jgi:hypothetical protein